MDKSNPFKILPAEISPVLTPPIQNNRVILNQSFSSLMEHSREHPEFSYPLPEDALRRPPLPNGTGLIINIGI